MGRTTGLAHRVSGRIGISSPNSNIPFDQQRMLKKGTDFDPAADSTVSNARVELAVAHAYSDVASLDI